MRRPRPDPQRLDVALAAGLLVLGLVDRRLTDVARPGPWVLEALAAAVLAAPLALRRTHPRVAVAAALAGAAAGQVFATAPDSLVTGSVVLIALAYGVGRHTDGRERLALTTVVVLVVCGLSAVHDRRELVFPVLASLSAVGVGALLRDGARMTRQLAERTHELDAARELRAHTATVDERRRIARELHDVIAHTVSIMVVQAGGARSQVLRDRDRARGALDQIEATGRDALAELDRLFGLLRDEAPAGGLEDLAAVVARTRDAGLDVALAVHGVPGRLEPGADLAAFRLVQEALTNVLKHAGPATARVDVRWEAAAVEVVVRDTGWGAGGPRGEGSRRGLAGMRERLAPLGGEVEAGPLRDGGFEVRARLPLAREEVHAA